MKRIWMVGFAITLAAMSIVLFSCNLPLPDFDSMVERFRNKTPTVQTLPPILPPEMETGAEEEPCGYVWATQELPEVSQDLRIYFLNAGLDKFQVMAEAYGENCIREDGSPVRFLTMYTDVRVTLPAAQLQDEQRLAEQAETVLRMVLDYPPEKLPGSLEGYLGITFVDPQGQTENLWFKRLYGKAALDKGLSGVELLTYLRGD